MIQVFFSRNVTSFLQFYNVLTNNFFEVFFSIFDLSFHLLVIIVILFCSANDNACDKQALSN